MSKPMDSKPSVCFGVDWESATADDVVQIPYSVADAGGAIHIVRDANGNTPLHFAAAYSKKVGVVEALIRAGAKPEWNDEWETPIMLAVRHHNVEAIRPLVEAGDEISFFWVAKNVQSSETAYAIASEAKVDWNKKNSHGHTPLQSAVAANNIAVVGGFIKGNGGLPHKQDFIFHFAIENGASREMVRLLITGKADMNYQGDGLPYDYEKPPILHCAIDNGASREMVRILIAGGADIDARNKKRLSPLDYAFEKGHKEIMDELTKAGGAGAKSGIAFGINWKNANALDTTGMNHDAYANPFGHPISWAASLCPDPGVIGALVASGANLHPHSFAGNDNHPINLAAANNPEVIPVLIRVGANIGESRFGDGWTPLHYAAQNNNCRAIVLLIQAGADVDAVNGQGYTPLYVALHWYIQPNSEIITTLVSKGANVNAVTWKRVTALDLMDKALDMENSHEGRNSPENMEIRKFLVDAGAVHFADLPPAG